MTPPLSPKSDEEKKQTFMEKEAPSEATSSTQKCAEGQALPHVNIPRERSSWNSWCIHYRGMFDRVKPVTHCKAGVEYSSVARQIDYTYSREDGHIYTSHEAHPCFRHEHGLTDGCSKCHFPTAEEIKAHDEEITSHVSQFLVARTAIIKHCEDKRGVAGKLDCPVCKKGTLSYTRTACNGHVHARCSTADCVRWME